MKGPERLSSASNPLLVRVRRLGRDGGAYRKLGEVLIEGEHLCGAAVSRGWRASVALISEAAWDLPERRALAQQADRTVILPEALLRGLSTLESPGDVAFVISQPAPRPFDPVRTTVVLDRLQDAGNVGSILRSASALGVSQVLAVKGTAALWSPKVLRAGMGAHFGLALIEGLEVDDVLRLGVPLVVTSSHALETLPQATLPRPCAWVFGHEGQGVGPAILAASSLQVRIPQPGGEESLNVAAAAAICFYEALRQTAQ